MPKKIYLGILLAIVIVLLVVTSIWQYKEKESYRSALTNQLNTDITELRSALSSNDLAYEEILRSGEWSKSHVNYLMGNNDEIRKIVEGYSTLAVQLGRKTEGFQYTETPRNALKLVQYFKDVQDSNKELLLDSNNKRVIEKAQTLNNKWSNTITKIKVTNIANDSWVKLLTDLEADTQSFLIENNIKNIEELWLERQEIQ